MSSNLKVAVDINKFKSSSDGANDDDKKSRLVRIVTGHVPLEAACEAYPEASEVAILDKMAWENGPTTGLLVDDLDVLSERQEHKEKIAAMKAEYKERAALTMRAMATLQEKHVSDYRILQEKNADLEKKLAGLKRESSQQKKKDFTMKEENEKLRREIASLKRQMDKHCVIDL